jgi:lysophospholipase L1-like esterase
MTRHFGPDDIAGLVVGAQDLQRTRDGVFARRLPAWMDAQMPDPGLDMMARMTSGVRLSLRTDAREIELDVLETGLQIAGEPRREATFDLCIGGGLVSRQTATAGRTLVVDRLRVPPAIRMDPGTASTLRFAGLAEGLKDIEIWLPQSAMVELLAMRITGGHQLDRSVSPRPLWIHYGSSISHGMEASGPSATWPAVSTRLAGLDLTSFGFAGQCLLDGGVARAMRNVPADLITLKLGVNVVNWDAMRERAFVPAVLNFLDLLRDVHTTTPIVVISPIFCPLVETSPGPTLRSAAGIYVPERTTELSEGALSLSRIRQLLAQIVARRSNSDENLAYLDGLELFASGDAGDLPDLLHPNAAGHERMGERFARVLSAMPFLASRQG